MSKVHDFHKCVTLRYWVTKNSIYGVNSFTKRYIQAHMESAAHVEAEKSSAYFHRIYMHMTGIIYIYTLTSHFIRYILLVPGWTPFAFRSALILRGTDSTKYWKHSSEILVHIVMIASHSCCRFVVCTSMMWISRSTTSQRCSIGLRSGDCGGRLSKVNSLSCSRNQSEMICDMVHYPAGSTSEDGTL